jgi:hypothetical protein
MKLMNMQKSYIVGFVLIVIIIAVAYFSGKSKGSEDYPEFPVPDDTPGSTINLDQAKVQRIAVGLHNDLDSFFLFERYNTSLWQEFASSSDTEFVAIYNYFNDKWYADKSKTLRERIESRPISWFSGRLRSTIAKILQRLTRLNLV